MKYFKMPIQIEITQWHVWFAWFPVIVEIMPDGGHKKVWLQKVKRCGEFFAGGMDAYWVFEYKEIKAKP